jgi:RHS repeat-associated protein
MGQSNRFVYDSLGRVATNFLYAAGATAPSRTNVFIYDAMNRVVQTIDPDGGTNTVVYNAIGKQQTIIDQLGRTISYTYDTLGRLTKTTYPDLTTESSTYDANGNRATSTDRGSRTTTYIYDALNRLTQTIYPDNTTNTMVYDGIGRVARTIDARGTITGFNYDTAGRRLAVTNAVGITGLQSVSSYGYDANGNQITFTDAMNHVTTNVFDMLNRQVQVKYPDGTTNSTGYDAAGRRVAGTNQDGIVTRFGYDGTGRLTSVTNAVNTAQQMVTRYQYDEVGSQIAQIDALNRTNLFAYDSMGRRIAHTRPDNATEGFTYDLAGNLVDNTNFNNEVMVSQYDAMNRLTNRSTLYVYDETYGTSVSFSYTATGQRQSMVDGYGTTTIYNYDNRDRLVQKNVAWNYNLTASLNYHYDANGNVTNLWSGMANGVNLIYSYDPLNRLTNVFSHGQLAASYRFDLIGNLQGMRYGNGVTNLCQYDSLNRLTNLVWKAGSSSLANFAYQLGATGNRTNLVETLNSQPSTAYAWSYDHLYRLTNENISTSGNLGYGYDPVGNRTNRQSSISQLPPVDYTYNTNDWLATDNYDNNGNTTVSGDNGYAYDVLNRLVNFNSQIYYTYDGDGNRVSKQAGGVTTHYLVDDRNPSGYPQVVEEYQSLNYQPSTLSRIYNYGLALISQQQIDTNTLFPSVLSYYGYDGHGSVRFLTDTNGSITDTYTYDAYGNLIGKTGSTPNNYLYAGQQWDPDLGMYYNRARYLNPNTGRFWTRDTAEGNNEDPLSLHKYLYGWDNPVNMDDPSGHDAEFSAGGMSGIMDIGFSFFAAITPVSSGAVSAAIPLPALPTSKDGQLLVGLIFAESSSRNYGGGENEDEKDEMGLTVLNRTYYSRLKGPHGYWNGFLGNGSVLSALQAPGQFGAYNSDRWKLVMNGDSLKPKAQLDKLQVFEKDHLRLSIEAANFCTAGDAPLPTTLATLGDPPVPGQPPVAFNKANDQPPSKRMVKFGRAGSHTFYTFRPGREAE